MQRFVLFPKIAALQAGTLFSEWFHHSTHQGVSMAVVRVIVRVYFKQEILEPWKLSTMDGKTQRASQIGQVVRRQETRVSRPARSGG